MEASALTHAGRRGLIARRSRLLRLQGDERLVSMLRQGNDHAFEAIVDRYQARLLGFCRQMLGSTEDAEDVLQEVFVNAHRAILADNRHINLRPWLYRIARNRCLNHLRKPAPEGQDSMDLHPTTEAASTHERVQNREEFRQLLTDVTKLPETQRSALLLREMDALSYEDIAVAMGTTVPSVKSLLVRARIALAEASQARQLTCGEVRLSLAEAAEGLAKASGPVRRHVRECDECRDFRSRLRTDSKVLAALFPIGPLAFFKSALLSKLGIGASSASGGAGAASAGGVGAGGAAVGGAGGSAGGLGTLGAAGAALGSKAVAGVVTAVVITAGAVAVKDRVVPVVPDSSPSHSHYAPSTVSVSPSAGATSSAPGLIVNRGQLPTSGQGQNPPGKTAKKAQAKNNNNPNSNNANANGQQNTSQNQASASSTTPGTQQSGAQTTGSSALAPTTTTIPPRPPGHRHHHHSGGAGASADGGLTGTTPTLIDGLHHHHHHHRAP